MPPTPPDDPPPTASRREFFSRLAYLSIDRVQQAGRRVADQITGADHHPPPRPPARYLRPPGALTEADYANTCSRCAACVRACPAECIQLSPDTAAGLPHIIARESPCVICDDLSCMAACPTGALRPLTDAAMIDMGTAEVDHHSCLRSTQRPDNGCTLCIDDCPIGERALGLSPAGQIDVRAGCTGCGVCERVCPTDPASIIVIPAHQRPNAAPAHCS